MQWFTMKRQHAIIVMADSLYYTKFKLYCKVRFLFIHTTRSDTETSLFSCQFKKMIYTNFENLVPQPGMEGNKNCYSDEHYLPTLFHVRIEIFNSSVSLNYPCVILNS